MREVEFRISSSTREGFFYKCGPGFLILKGLPTLIVKQGLGIQFMIKLSLDFFFFFGFNKIDPRKITHNITIKKCEIKRNGVEMSLRQIATL